MIDLDEHREKFEEYNKWTARHLPSYQKELKKYAIEKEIEEAARLAREAQFEEAILKLIDIVEVIQNG